MLTKQWRIQLKKKSEKEDNANTSAAANTSVDKPVNDLENSVDKPMNDLEKEKDSDGASAAEKNGEANTGDDKMDDEKLEAEKSKESEITEKNGEKNQLNEEQSSDMDISAD